MISAIGFQLKCEAIWEENLAKNKSRVKIELTRISRDKKITKFTYSKKSKLLIDCKNPLEKLSYLGFLK